MRRACVVHCRRVIFRVIDFEIVFGHHGSGIFKVPSKTRSRFDSSHSHPNKKDSPETRARVLEGLRKGYSVSKAANDAGVGRSTALLWRQNDEEYNKQWEDAMEEGIDLLEEAARLRAVDGILKPVFHKGDICGHIQEYSDGLLTLMLRGKRANVYNTDRVEHTGPGGGAIDHKITVEFVSAAKRKKNDD